MLSHQSTPVVKRQLEAQRRPIERRLPARMVDTLNLVTLEIGGSTDFVPSLIKYYLHTLVPNEKTARTLYSYLKSELASGKAEKRLSLKGRQIDHELDLLKSLTHIENTTDLLKGIILKINDDVLLASSVEGWDVAYPV